MVCKILKNKYLSTFAIYIKRKVCDHLFDPPDMQDRDENGNVKWMCCKCQKIFVAHCGLDILKFGKCTGRWGLSTAEKINKSK